MNRAVRGISGEWTLVCRGVALSRGSREVLRDVDLTLRAGDCLALLGPNGAGKTTLLLALLGLLAPSRGEILLDGAALHRLPARVRARFAAYVPQGVEHVPGFTVYEFVAAARYPHVPPLWPLSSSDLDAVQSALALCGLTALAHRPMHAISGGERQKALLAGAIAQNAHALFLDEPNTALDPAHQVELVRRLQQWHAGGRSLIVVSHDLRVPMALGARVIALRDQRVAADGPCAEVLTPQRLEAIFGTSFERLTSATGQAALVSCWPAPGA
jgi:iron complex transport system ATP-binding protein